MRVPVIALPAIMLAITLSGCGSSAASSDDISKMATVQSDCANYDTLTGSGKNLCDTETQIVRNACNGDDLDRGAFINNSPDGVTQAEAELSALCPEKANQ